MGETTRGYTLFFDPKARFVRVYRQTEADLIEFAFGVGCPELMVDMTLPRRAFQEFCRHQKAIDLTPAGMQVYPQTNQVSSATEKSI